MATLSESQLADYRRDGFVFPVEAFSRDQARHYLDQLQSFERVDGQEFGKGHNVKPHLLFRWVDEIVHHSAVLDPPVARLDWFKDGSRLSSGLRPVVVLSLLLCLLAACTPRPDDNSRSGGFYGGISGGMSRP